MITKISKKNKIIFVDCGCNYGFYSFYTASLSSENLIFSVEASKKTLELFLKNLALNKFSNITYYNNAISNNDNDNILFNESENDWESSQTHKNFKISSISEIKSMKIDTLLKPVNCKDYDVIIKLDIEGNEMSAIEGAFNTIKNNSPLIIIEFSKYNFDKKENVKYLKNFLFKNEYSIYNTNKIKTNLEDVINKINTLGKGYDTIGNYFLIKNKSKILENFILND